MARKDGPLYTLGFAAFICTVCGLFVAGAAVLLKDEQEINKRIDRQKNVLLAAGLIKADDAVTPEAVQQMFKEKVTARVVELSTGEVADDIDPAGFDQGQAAADPKTSVVAPENEAEVARIPKHGLVFRVETPSRGALVVIPVEGKGLWSTLYGFLALDAQDISVARGIAFYEHGETPGLGGEIENPKWQARWNGREVFDDKFNPVITVIKGKAGPASEDPRDVDGLSGATITSNGVTHLVRFWVGADGYGPYLKRLAGKGGA
jgi:Na+-transporting NADH:ubiquinone oxidoreductase subunit C